MTLPPDEVIPPEPEEPNDPYLTMFEDKPQQEAVNDPRKINTLAGSFKEREKTKIQEINHPTSETVIFTTGYECTDLGNAYRLIKLHGDEMRYVPELGKWVVWDGTRWSPDNNGAAMRMAISTARTILQEAYKESDEKRSKELSRWAFSSQSAYKLKEMTVLAKDLEGITKPLTQFDQDPHLLNCMNGTINLITGELQPHNRKNFIMKRVELVYYPEEKSQLWETFLKRIQNNNQEIIDYLQRAIGYSLSGETSEQCFFVLYGIGANGKTVFDETILRIMGEDYSMNAQAETILAHDGRGQTNDIARLQGARFVTVNEIERGKRMAESKVKELTGSDTVTARFLFHEPFQFKPAFKLWIRTNHKPVIKDVDHGIWRRVRLIPFTVNIPADEQDKNLLSKLQEEAPGILTWAVCGAVHWYKNGLNSPEAISKAINEYKDEMDILKPFFDECCILSETETVGAKELHEKFRAWCDGNGEKGMNLTAFGRAITERGFDKYRDNSGIKYIGIGIRKGGV